MTEDRSNIVTTSEIVPSDVIAQLSDPRPRICVGGDLFRFEAADLWAPRSHVGVLQSLARTIFADHEIFAVTPEVYGIRPGPDLISWWVANLQANLSDDLRDAVGFDLQGSVYLGFETPDKIWEVVCDKCLIAFDLRLHPCRYADDCLFLARVHGIDINDIVNSEHIERHLRFAAEILKRRNRNTSTTDRQDALVALQVAFDSARLGVEGFARLADHSEHIRDIADDHRLLFVAPHPFGQPYLDDMEFLLEIPNARFAMATSYDLIRSGQIRTVVALSSSLLHEAQRFQVDVDCLRPDLGFCYPISATYTPLRLEDLLGPVADRITGRIPEIHPGIRRFNANTLRTLFGLGTAALGEEVIEVDWPQLPSQRLSFVDADLVKACHYGWGPPESWGIWGIGQLNILNFAWPESSPESALVLLEARSFTKTRTEVAELEIWFEGQQKGKFTVPSIECGRLVTLVFNICRPRYDNICQLVLVNRKPLSPASMGVSNDDRKLSIALHSIEAIYS